MGIRQPVAMLVGLGLGFSLPDIAASAPVDDPRLISAADDNRNWMTYGCDFPNQRIPPLTQIDRHSVRDLVPHWIYLTGANASL